MNAVVSVCLLACALGIIVYLLSRRETTRRSQLTVWTPAATPTSLPTSAAGRTTAAFCCI